MVINLTGSKTKPLSRLELRTFREYLAYSITTNYKLFPTFLHSLSWSAPISVFLCIPVRVPLFYNSYFNGGNKPPGVRRRCSHVHYTVPHRIHRPDHHRWRLVLLTLLRLNAIAIHK